jgi:integrase
MNHAERYYCGPNGQTSEVADYGYVVRAVRELYGTIPACEFGALALKAVRERFVNAGNCRGFVNQRTRRIVRIFKWGVSEQLVPVMVHQELKTVEGLRANRTPAPESLPVLPVSDVHVEATIPFLNRHVRAMVELQRHTGMRPGEVCRLRLSEIDRSGDQWIYHPAHHKTAHHGNKRMIMIGPRARAVIEAFVAGGSVVDPSAPLFSPFRMREERFAVMRAMRVTRVQPSQLNRRNRFPVRPVGNVYTTFTYAHNVSRAARAAGVPHWHPNQLRHTFATAIRRNYGLEAAQVLLGHSRADVTQIYAERNVELAASVAASVG